MSSDADGQLNARRRGFLQSLGGLAAVPSLSSVLVAGDLYINNKLGFAFRKPTKWRFEHLRTFADLRNEYEFASPNEELVAELRSGPLPLAVISQAPLLRALSSSMTVYAEDNPLREGESLSEAMPDILRGTSSFVDGFRIVVAPRLVPVAGTDAVEYAATFTYRDRLGNAGPVRNRSLLVLRQSVLYTLNMLDIPADGIVAEAEFNEVRQSIVFA
ncbi:MAG: hypothetical protein IPJ99_11785 [Betaproteobacteria bacterium]|nr:hypothetical protein [Betaproteobacteria bacterium]